LGITELYIILISRNICSPVYVIPLDGLVVFSYITLHGVKLGLKLDLVWEDSNSAVMKTVLRHCN